MELESLDKLLKQRRATRTSFTKIAKQVSDLIEVENVNITEVQSLSGLLERKIAILNELDAKVLDLLLDDDEADIDKEIEGTDEYQKKYLDLKQCISGIQVQQTEYEAGSVNSRSSNQQTKTFKLPKLEFRTFGGDLKEWLPFWSQFSKIHEDPEISEEDKFQYLIQATVKGSRARQVVESFPPTRVNYAKAIESLKSRFGQEDLLVEVYVRELLRLVLHKASESKSRIALSQLYDQLETQIRSLESLGVTTDKCASMLFPLVESCLPEDLLRIWQRSTPFTSAKNAKDRLEGLMKFLKSEVEGEERINLATSGFDLKGDRTKEKMKHKAKESDDNIPTAMGLLASNQRKDDKCVFCEGHHSSADCFSARKMSMESKQKLLKEKGCCYMCLRSGHMIKTCKAKNIKCIICGGKHVVLMCRQLLGKQLSVSKEGSNSDENTAQEVSLANVSSLPKVLLQTLRVNIRSDSKTECVRALVDTGSQKSYILRKTALKMGYNSLRKETISHSLFGGVTTQRNEHEVYRVRVGDLNDEFRCNFEALGQEVICGDISHVTEGEWMNELKKLKIDITDNETSLGPIEVLIGADVAGKLLTGRREMLSCGLVAVETLLGWTLMGKIPDTKRSEENEGLLVTSMFIKEASITDLWRLDVIGISDPVENVTKKEREIAAKDHFLQSVLRTEEGRYQVRLPWTQGHPVLPSNLNLAERRLGSLKKKLPEELFQDYNEVFEDWLAEGIIEEVPESEGVHCCHYLPHRPVVKENSATTRIRPVFDASAKLGSSPSLNQCLETGPNLIELIPNILLRFREKKIGVVADIKRAFLQIGIHPEDRNFLCFLWWKSYEKMEVRVFRHARVVFGVKCSPFLLGAIIEHHLLREDDSNHSLVNQKLLNSFYVDNVVASVDNEAELSVFISESVKVMAEAKFELRGWEWSNEKCQSTHENSYSVVLGLLWNRNSDELKVNMSWIRDFHFDTVTKRIILSISHKVFDPIGFSCPVMLCPKLLLQKMWKMELDWDTEVDDTIKKEFLLWYEELPQLEEIGIPRWVQKSVNMEECSLHTFCDASQKAYAAVVFLRVETSNNVQLHLLAAKTRVSPIKKISMPRLELMAATIGARLAKSVLDGLGWENIKTFFWSDSTTVIAWITRGDKWTVFVRNRVNEIRKITCSEAWKYVPGELNPADLPSRGCKPEQLVASRWWEGPAWLKETPGKWFACNSCPKEDEINMEKVRSTAVVNVNCLVSVNQTDWYYRYFSNFVRIVRMLGWLLRFIRNSRSPIDLRQKRELTVEEYATAERRVVRFIQEDSFSGLKDDRLRTLRVFQDSEGIIRLKTKITYRDDHEDFCQPAVLPSQHEVVKRLIMTEHKIQGHIGLQMLLNNLRERYWILNGRKTIRSVLSKCVICKRHCERHLEVVSPPLPTNRVRDAAVFEIVGLDLTGPLYLQGGIKVWVCLFTCAVFRAVHLELVSSVSTEAFLQALRRFVARRGRCSVIYSDNGTNFTGASNLLRNLNWEDITKYSTARRIEWRFNPPGAPWWGGWWERLIRLLKDLLKRILGRSCLTYEEMMTTLCDCESLMNSRPLTYIMEEGSELVPLSPSLFLQDIREIGVPDLDTIDSQSLKKRFRYRQTLKRDLRKRFRSEYLGQLVLHRGKEGTRTVAVGDVVLIGCDNLKRIDWPLGYVIEVIPGKDGVVRTVKLKTGQGELLRPIQRIYPLEVSSDDPIVLSGNCDSSGVPKDDNNGNPVVTRSGRAVRVPDRLDL